MRALESGAMEDLRRFRAAARSMTSPTKTRTKEVAKTRSPLDSYSMTRDGAETPRFINPKPIARLRNRGYAEQQLPVFRPDWRPAIPVTPPPKRHPYDQWSPDARALDLVGDKWTLLIIRDLAAGPRRFVELQRVLPGISTEQLRSRLNRMVADGLLTRQRYREVPPRVDYELTERSRALMPVIGELARWGYDWTWGAPRQGERIDIGAVMRCGPGLLEPTRSGTLECVVIGERGTDRSYVLTAARKSVSISEQPAESPDARVTGSQSAWVRALGPDGDNGALTYEGDRALADSLLSGLIDAASGRQGRAVA